MSQEEFEYTVHPGKIYHLAFRPCEIFLPLCKTNLTISLNIIWHLYNTQFSDDSDVVEYVVQKQQQSYL